ncbi:MAG: DUF1549 domain-containing protein [Acidobacteria bacterium]|nr:DUF1549 domain-containing protein [Acidobacteriota bacterium]
MGLRLLNTRILTAWLAATLAVLSAHAAEDRRPEPAPVSLRVVPDSATLSGAQASQQFIVLGQYADGLERDLTSTARFSLSDSHKGEINQSGKLVVRSSGELILTAAIGDRSAKVAIRIDEAEKPRRVTFAREVEGILTKRGCNDTTCHGGVKGRGGFRLSVYGVYPWEDYKAIVEGGTFRVLTVDENPKHPRIDVKQPEKSLVVLKPTFSVPHEGGVRFEVGSADHETILNWIRSGAPYGDEAGKPEATVERIEVSPKDVVLQSGARQQLIVTAHLSNGRREDITEQVRYLTSDSGVADVSETGVVQAKKTGETNILIRTPGHTLSADVGVIEKPVAKYPKLAARNYVDQHVFAKLRKFQLLPSELSSDQEFLRRVCLDLTGTLPPPQRVREFVADKDPQKRDRLVEILMDSPEYVDYWSFRFGDLLRATYVTSNNTKATRAYQNWITNSIATNKPYDQVARERIGAQGYSAPARNFYYISELTTPDVLMPELIRLFMGRRIECAQCHSHPFEAWSQNQYWGLAAFFAGYTEVRESTLIIDVLGGGHVDQPRDMMVMNPRTKEKVVPAFLDGTKLPPSEWMDPRMHLAKWLTSHPYFAEATVNRLWSFFFGRGIVEPVDDFRSTNPPTHPELLRALAKDFKDSGYDLKRLMRTIVQSRTYQLSATPNASNKEDKIDYSHALARPLEAAVLLDAITSVTGVPEKFELHPLAGGGDAPLGTRAMQMIADICPSQFMDDFGRSTRRALPAGSPQPNLLEALHMMAGPAYNAKISGEGGRLDGLLRKKATDDQILEEFYIATLMRPPTTEEKSGLLKFLDQRSSRREETLAGLVWAILNSREFAYNH